MKKLRDDARVLLTSFGALLALRADPHQCGDEDCDCDGESEAVYGANDWRDTCAPSFAFDGDGDLRQHDGTRCYGPAIEFVEGTSDDLDWDDTDGIFLVDRITCHCPAGKTYRA